MLKIKEHKYDYLLNTINRNNNSCNKSKEKNKIPFEHILHYALSILIKNRM